MQIDDYDKKIISLLQNDNMITQQEISEKVNLSSSAVNRRVIALRKSGIIKANISVIDAQKVGRPITIIAQVKIINERLDLLKEDKQRFARCPQVQQVYYVTGEYDFFLVLNVKDMSEYELLTHELFFSSENIKNFNTVVSMENIKQTLSIII